MPKPYGREFRGDVVRVARRREPGVTVEQIAKDFGVHPMTLFKWLRQAEVDDGAKPGTETTEAVELGEARRRIRLLEKERPRPPEMPHPRRTTDRDCHLDRTDLPPPPSPGTPRPIDPVEYERPRRPLMLRDLELSPIRAACLTAGVADLMASGIGRSVAIVSNNSSSAVSAYLSADDLTSHVQAVFGRDNPDPDKMKPDPYRVRQAFGSATDVMAAHAAGIKAIGYADKPSKADRLCSADADTVTDRSPTMAPASASLPAAIRHVEIVMRQVAQIRRARLERGGNRESRHWLVGTYRRRTERMPDAERLTCPRREQAERRPRSAVPPHRRIRRASGGAAAAGARKAVGYPNITTYSQRQVERATAQPILALKNKGLAHLGLLCALHFPGSTRSRDRGGAVAVRVKSEPLPDRERLAGSAPLARAARQRARRLGGVAARIGVPVIAVLLLVGGAVEIGPAIAAAEGQGERGYFVATTEYCGGHGCAWTGDFLLPNGRVGLHRVTYRGSYVAMKDGAVVPALNSGSRTSVYPRDESRRWIVVMVLMLFAAVTLPWWAWNVPTAAIRHHRRRRTARASRAAAG